MYCVNRDIDSECIVYLKHILHSTYFIKNSCISIKTRQNDTLPAHIVIVHRPNKIFL